MRLTIITLTLALGALTACTPPALTEIPVLQPDYRPGSQDDPATSTTGVPTQPPSTTICASQDPSQDRC